MNLKTLRESMRLTQDAVAERLGITRTTVSMWESGDTMPRADKLPQLAKLYDCTIDDLFQTNDDQTA